MLVDYFFEQLLHFLFCPSCESQHIVKNGKIHNGQQNDKYRDCGRQFVENRQQKIITQSSKDLKDLVYKREIVGVDVGDKPRAWLRYAVERKPKNYGDRYISITLR